jgi:hypothetical protein
MNDKEIEGGRGRGRVTRVISRGKGAVGGEDPRCCGRNCSRVVVKIASDNERFACGCNEVKDFPMTLEAQGWVGDGGIIADGNELAQRGGSDTHCHCPPRYDFGEKTAADREGRQHSDAPGSGFLGEGSRGMKKASPNPEGKITRTGGRGRIDLINAVKQPCFLYENEVPTGRVALEAVPSVTIKGDKGKSGRGGARLPRGRARPFPREAEKMRKGKDNRVDGTTDKKTRQSRSGRQQTNGSATQKAGEGTGPWERQARTDCETAFVRGRQRSERP